ncbi:DUF3159 domain-containing protein [Mycobacterium sp. 21AC1]|uniref:DUF3159 domain-containing protein n=1 Tax=[Mycobacterium] appelbergii TaxID=2939269 RepID=UPI002938FDC6|nr:DUF3159 domain-containing protein [Mycobacterium sp. 21AC1]MDV3126370.1 DUF3159 domain-containing protein [Mycobacterium sp. 21AC1]
MHKSERVTEEREPTLLERVGGVSGLVYASVPTFAYVIVNAIAGLGAAVAVAVAVSAALIVVRRARGEPIQPAVSGLLGVALAAAIAYFTGSADNYFLPGIWISLVSAAAVTVSVLVRRPLVGVIWNLLRSSGPDPAWRSDKAVLRGFDIASTAFVVLFAARFVVQQWLYDGGHTGWLAVARIGMGYPLLGVALLVVFWSVRRANRLAVAG